MKIHNQPMDGAFGDIIKKWLASDTGEFFGISAFAKNSGVLMLEDSINIFRSNAGIVTFIVGIDLDGTSIEALKNLFRISDNLYIVHSENNITFHPKIYALKTEDRSFVAVGSNNLTKGGLFNNYESVLIIEDTANSTVLLSQINKVISQFTDVSSNTVVKIESEKDIDKLAQAGYIRSEVYIQKQIISTLSEKSDSRKNRNKLFGTEKIIKSNNIARITSSSHKQTSNKLVSNQEMPIQQNDVFWFETGKMTGGSRNILDLSKAGKLQDNSGTAQNTIYYKDATHVKGGVLFFDLDPDVPSEKEITINFEGTNYSPATIKYAPDNSNWRIQIKGTDNSTEQKITEVLPVGSMVNKILVFEKVNSDKYILTIYPHDDLNNFRDNSVFWATNGNNKNGRKFGYILKDLEE